MLGAGHRQQVPGLESMMVLSTAVALVASIVHTADGGVSCVDVEQKLAASQQTLAACTESAKQQTSAKEQCEAALTESGEKLNTTSQKVEVCVAQKEQLCNDAAAQAASLLQGTSRAVGSCIPPEMQGEVQALLDGWFSLTKALAQLDEYAGGATDLLPRTFGPSEPERHLARATGLATGVPLWNRRLLTAAFGLTAPTTWSRLRAGGTAAIDAFFGSRGPLPEGFITEANGEHSERAGPAGPPLTAALRLALSYLEISDCDRRADSLDCGRARQLVDLLDDTGPLIVRRRVEEMYATPCAELTPEVVRGWLQDFPTSKSKEKQAALGELAAAAKSKLYLCYLADSRGDPVYSGWVANRLPPSKLKTGHTLPLVDELASTVGEGSALDRCGRAVRAFQRLEANGCAVERPDALLPISLWAHGRLGAGATRNEQICHDVASLAWSGAALVFPASPEEHVKIDEQGVTAMARLRKGCDERQGSREVLARTLGQLSAIAQELGETPSASPWRFDTATGLTLEEVRFDEAQRYQAWIESQLERESACEALGLGRARCEACAAGSPAFDCELTRTLATTWHTYRQWTLGGAAGLGALLVVILYVRRLRRARRTFLEPSNATRVGFESVNIPVTAPALRVLFPSRYDRLALELPKTPAWERWGSEALAVLAPSAQAVREADVNHAASLALRDDLRVVFLLHADTATPDLGAVRAILDWAARGGTRAVQVLPLARSRLAWATRDEDLLDLVESTSLRGNPFEVRGPVRSSSQFWNRERLVAGLLTEARAGHWVVVTGLRRFGKSSLGLEVARRTSGPSAYVDLAGFLHEVTHGETPGVAVEAILRTLVMRLTDSAAARFPAATLPPHPTGALDAPALAAWLRALATACGTSSGSPPPPMLLLLDEVEQLLTGSAGNLGRALEVLATLTGRLRSAFSEPSSPHAGSTVSVVLCAAMHPLLWAPLSTLGGQSLMGAFPSISVPALDGDAAHAMMQGLGSRQGIRFEEDALEALVKASHGVPLLLRRLGTSVLELYDADRARHGALGAVRIGIEGATEAIRREERGGSPLRVWVESEIASADGAAGVLLRALANEPKVPVERLTSIAEGLVTTRFTDSGLAAHLTPAELKRRAQEAASVMVRLLAESRLLEAHGDLTAPEAYSLSDGVMRRILSEGKKP